jgi:hypothetical protein
MVAEVILLDVPLRVQVEALFTIFAYPIFRELFARLRFKVAGEVGFRPQFVLSVSKGAAGSEFANSSFDPVAAEVHFLLFLVGLYKLGILFIRLELPLHFFLARIFVA